MDPAAQREESYVVSDIAVNGWEQEGEAYYSCHQGGFAAPSSEGPDLILVNEDVNWKSSQQFQASRQMSESLHQSSHHQPSRELNNDNGLNRSSHHQPPRRESRSSQQQSQQPSQRNQQQQQQQLPIRSSHTVNTNGTPHTLNNTTGHTLNTTNHTTTRNSIKSTTDTKNTKEKDEEKGEYSFHFGTTVIDKGKRGKDLTVTLLMMGACVIGVAAVVVVLVILKPWESNEDEP
ncbi:expressed unknown protein [Seminavis robusta]|uniref:Uncharacterized protein n=1 Tax=Seminavis robusta TaxID=568900 RepID=A0A9N8HC80_9STRA|nr:expressed unknown protein [Seminavis robusta]|eukprot:Sro210_g087540.1 n/a (233) ;mRNA; r:16194-16892